MPMRHSEPAARAAARRRSAAGPGLPRAAARLAAAGSRAQKKSPRRRGADGMKVNHPRGDPEGDRFNGDRRSLRIISESCISRGGQAL